MAHEYIGVNGVSRKITTKYIGVNGVSRAIKNEYIGVAGVARLCFSAINYSIPTSLTWSYSKGGTPSTKLNGFTVTTSENRDNDDTAVSSSFTVAAGTIITLTGTLAYDANSPRQPTTVPGLPGATVTGRTGIHYAVALVNDEDNSQINIASGTRTVSSNQGTIPPKGSITISKSGTYHLVVSGSTAKVSVTYYSDEKGVHSTSNGTTNDMTEGTFTFSFS